MTEESDEALMVAYARGEAPAFEALYERYRRSLYAYFYRHVSDEVTANDLYQGCWEKVIGARKRYDRRAPFRAWLFRIAHNHLVDHYRARRDTAPLPPELPDEKAPTPETALDGATQRERLREAIAALPREQREAISLRLDAGLGPGEIARVTGVGHETAKSRLRYATRRLKDVLQP